MPGARRFVRVVVPSVHSGIGAALRQAYDMNGQARVFDKFQDLLDRLN